MRAPQVQFASAPAGARALAIAVLVLGALLVGLSVWEYVESVRALKAADADIAAARASAERRRNAPLAPATPQISEQRVNAINGAIARLNIPWGELFAAFESEQAKDIALLALLPDARNRALVVQAEALKPRAMLDFVERLRANAAFEDVFLTKHERREQDVAQPYRFSVEIRWREEP